MENLNLKDLTAAMRLIADEKKLSEEAVLEVIENAIAVAWRRENGDRDQRVRSDLNQVDGSAIVYTIREIVEEVENEQNQILLEDAKKIREDAELGETIEESHEITTLGRVAAQTAKQVVLQGLRDAEREVVLNEFEDKIGTIAVGTVQRIDRRVDRLTEKEQTYVKIEFGKAVGTIPPREQSQGERLSIGSRVKVLVKEIERENRGPQLILSRSDKKFIELLFRQEVPEMETGAVEIKSIAREAGRRTKIAVASSIPGVDPVGTFVGSRGTRVQSIMGEIGDQEKIDIVPWDENIEEFIRNALSPAEISSIKINEEEKTADVFVLEDQQSVAIGRGGQNVRTASKLTGYDINLEVKEPEQKKKPKNVEDSLFDTLSETEDH